VNSLKICGIFHRAAVSACKHCICIYDSMLRWCAIN